ncbi:hypothetical protein CEXT_150341 [Caerostris extrusa]|uniref:Uncharacterized protein n=1 Tax=Caerostris extrusa TaxID=172846 RepID=A0AAV4XGI0_CAEEX|nr:hypothetical protein CEXT_150341 [Caerostris extrusa]
MKASIFHQTISKSVPKPSSQLSLTLLPFRKIFFRWKNRFHRRLRFDGRASCEKGRGRGTHIRRNCVKMRPLNAFFFPLFFHQTIPFRGHNNEWTRNMKDSIFLQTISKTAPEPVQPAFLDVVAIPKNILPMEKNRFHRRLRFDGRGSREKDRGRGTHIRRKVSKCDH